MTKPVEIDDRDRVDLDWTGAEIKAAQESGLLPEMVDWLDPKELVRAGLRQTYSRTIGAYADMRPMQALAERREIPASDGRRATSFEADTQNFGHETATWIDFVSDLGDGFDATYAIAYLVSKKSLSVTDPAGGCITLPASQTLVFGGDLAYPDATLKEYHNRCIAPYVWASTPPPQDTAPAIGDPIDQPAPQKQLFCIAGNHDWHDGLVAFTKVFLSSPLRLPTGIANIQRIGTWNVPQTRSYFALAASESWHIWGVDLGMNHSIDDAQMQYFADASAGVRDDDNVIVLVHEPIWLRRGGLAPIEDIFRLVEQRRGRVRALLAGDLHHYTRFEVDADQVPQPSQVTNCQRAPLQLITAGGGGAFLHTTQHQSPSISVTPPNAGATPWRASRQAAYPNRCDSIKLLREYFRPATFLRRASNWRYILAFGIAYFLIGAANEQIAREPYTEAQVREARADYDQALQRYVDTYAPTQQPRLPDCDVAMWRITLEDLKDNLPREACSRGTICSKQIWAFNDLEAKRLKLYERDRWHNVCFRSARWVKSEIIDWTPDEMSLYRAVPSVEPDMRGTSEDKRTRIPLITSTEKKERTRDRKQSILACAAATSLIPNVDPVVAEQTSCIARYEAVTLSPETSWWGERLALFSWRTWKYYQSETTFNVLFAHIGGNPFAAFTFFVFILALSVQTYLSAPEWHQGAPAASATKSYLATVGVLSIGLGLIHFYMHYSAATFLDVVAQRASELVEERSVQKVLWQMSNGEAVGWLLKIILHVLLAGVSAVFAIAILTVFAALLSRFGWHRDLFSSTAVTGYKHFLRLKIDKEQRLTIYAIGIDGVPRGGWEPAPPGTAPRLEPSTALEPHLIERPLVFER